MDLVAPRDAEQLMNLAEFTKDLRGAIERMPEAREAGLRKAAELVRDEAKALIGAEDDAWSPLADSTVEEKERLGFTGKVSSTDPLLRTGELRASIKVGHVTPEHAIVGTDDPIVRFQEFGTERIPPRPFIGMALHREKDKIEAALGMALIANLRGREHG